MKGQAVNALCQMTGLNRAGFYRSRRLRQASPVEMEIRDEMQKIALESPAYGYRRITVELQRHGFDINDKRVLRMMLEDKPALHPAPCVCGHLPTRGATGLSTPTWRASSLPRRSTSSGWPISPTFDC